MAYFFYFYQAVGFFFENLGQFLLKITFSKKNTKIKTRHVIKFFK